MLVDGDTAFMVFILTRNSFYEFETSNRLTNKFFETAWRIFYFTVYA